MAATWITSGGVRHMFDMLACRENSSVSTSDPMARYLEPILNTVTVHPQVLPMGYVPVFFTVDILSQFVLCKASLTA